MDDLSTLTPVEPDQGKAQWVQGILTGTDKDNSTRTHTVGIPHLMPGTIIFVHGVNSEGEWYKNAAEQFSVGLNKRLGRTDLKSLDDDPSNSKRFLREKDGKRARSPILPFYWGYSVPSDQRKKVVEGTGDVETGALCDPHGNPLRKDGTWGGGPFQNGTGDLLAFWRQSGFQSRILHNKISLDRLNPVVGRHLLDCPTRLYYVHAARRLAHLVKTIRADLPNEPINIVAHSQGTMVALCALFYLDREGVRGPDTVILNSSPYHFSPFKMDFLMAAEGDEVQSEDARVATFAQAAAILEKARVNFKYLPAPDAPCSHEPAHRHKYDDYLFAHQPPNNPQWHAEIGAGDIAMQRVLARGSVPDAANEAHYFFDSHHQQAAA